MGFFGKIFDRIRGPSVRSSGSRVIEDYFWSSADELKIKFYVLNLAVKRLADALSLADFEVYHKKKLVKDEMWFAFNYEPNQNETQNEFLGRLVTQMVFNRDGALVVMKNGGFYVAENFDVIYKAYHENIYSSIELVGGLHLRETFTSEDVLHFKLNNERVLAFVGSVMDEYATLIKGAISNYNRGNALKLALNIDTIFDQEYGKEVVGQDKEGHDITKADYILDDMFSKRFKAVFSDRDSLTPLEEGLTISEIVKSSGNTKSGAVTTRDIADTIDDVLNLVADAFSIPRGLLKGDVADIEAMTANFVRFAVNPLADIIQTEVNRKVYGRKRLAKGDKLKIQTNSILTASAKEFAAAGEALFRIGAYSIDDILRKMGEEPLETEWSQARFVTKNYEMFESLMEGGEETGQEIVKQNPEAD